MDLRTIAIIDDDATTRKVLQWVLERHGFVVVEVIDAEQAVGLCKEPKLGVAALIADVRLRAEMTGLDVALAVLRSYPQLPILITSGTPPEGWTREEFAKFQVLLGGRVDFLAKPFTAQTLAEKILNLLSGKAASEAQELYRAGGSERHSSGLAAFRARQPE